MEYTEIMVRYGELSTKGKNRKSFIDRLHGNVAKVLKDYPDLKMRPHRDRLHIQLNGVDAKPVMEKLKNVFGIQTFSLSVKVSRNFEDVKQKAVEMMHEAYKPGMSFKVGTKRSDHTYELDTNQINLQLGDAICDAFPGIDVEMKKPDIKISVEVRQDGIYLSYLTVKGAGGLPVGTAGKAMLMLSGGIDSPVAGYLAMKRGVDIEMVHFFSPPYTSEQALNKAKELTSKLTAFGGNIKFIEVPFAEIQETIKAGVPEGYLMTIQRRFMLRLTDLIREQENGLAIFNGEAVGQVASQTLESMAAINDVTTTPILRPVATMDKTEIIRLAEKIDTFNLSIQPFEDCCTVFAPPAPKTRPNIEKTRKFESSLDVDGLIQRSMAGIKITTIEHGDKFMESDQENISSLL
ncbi:putative tRNA sulfurtransferase [Companilactobacillus crustorum]|uniref:Probable tRNA sulfurtransferase n=3 Tax=Companilactobacillus TaxID=2767879 RepID=A0A837RH83_9LACO|nr:tRNA uracil 4-sulfurtransferase ThiI [Companilactobacillus crustorum]HCD08184.1 tRNA 4-thiouridine(8) synthase ThiI [Lactobacillus sp.]KRK42757.1 thiamine biosynthesis protein ThiI [Companilactobacillus crustorum JCM 15951]KRO20445.1 thiamine biosynthesis protein ThiI [Companilactobacillus crustorum]WDT66354.1 tRNA 4-thiouridine(8) synthase ThiI [Companilactobacillus crustorum]GEO76397.1 putative tRNA sulfurtransferase [Companilactobacillus crustorum]